MGSRNFIAIKKTRKSSKKQTKVKSPTEKDMKARKGEKFVRDNFVVWQYNYWCSSFSENGVDVWEFLRKYLDEWTDEQRADYVNSLDLIEEASDEFVEESNKWFESEIEKLKDVDRKTQSEILRSKPEYMDYKPCTENCNAMIFDIIAAKKGAVKTPFIEPEFACCNFCCESGYIVDFDKNEFYVLDSRMQFMFDKQVKYETCPLLYPLEKLYKNRMLYLVKKFKFVELLETKEKFLKVLEAYKKATKEKDTDWGNYEISDCEDD